MSEIKHDSATPAHGQQVITAVAFVHDIFDGVTKVFLPRRAKTKAFLPGLYEMIGGHIDFGEDIVAGLEREIREETNMNVRLGDPFASFTYMNKIKGSHSVEVVYFAQFTDPIENIRLDPEDHSEYGWFSLDEVMATKSKIVPPPTTIDLQDHEEDPEYLAILKGFELLESQSIDFGHKQK